MSLVSRAQSARRKPRSLEELLGVTRVARLTGLDRTGVEVACAIRPTGHVLQVANGKGRTWAQARQSALGEAAELWASEGVHPEALRYGTARGFRALGFTVWDGDLGSAGKRDARGPWTAEVFAAFREGVDLLGRERILVPAAALHCAPAGAPLLGPLQWRWTTNGLGAHSKESAALRKALLEAIERSELAQALPNGFTEAALRARALEVSSWPPGLRAWGQRFAAASFDLVLCDLTPSRGLGLPVGGALLIDRERGPQPVSAGYACDPDPSVALESALLEAAQSRLTDIHGGRDDVTPMAAADVERLTAWARKLKPRRSFQVMARRAPRTVPGLLRALQRAGHRRAAAFRLSPEGSPLSVVKVVVPSFSVSGLL